MKKNLNWKPNLKSNLKSNLKPNLKSKTKFQFQVPIHKTQNSNLASLQLSKLKILNIGLLKF